MILIDRSIPKSVCYAILSIHEDVLWIGDLYPPSAKDVEWLRDAGDKRHLVISRDKKIRTRPAERQAIADHGVGAFILNQKRGPSRWEYLRLLVCGLDEMQHRFETMQRPFIVVVDSQGRMRTLR